MIPAMSPEPTHESHAAHDLPPEGPLGLVGRERDLARLEEAEKRDHRTLGRQLGFFSIHDEIGPGLIVWHAKGGLIRTFIENYWRDLHIC